MSLMVYNRSKAVHFAIGHAKSHSPTEEGNGALPPGDRANTADEALYRKQRVKILRIIRMKSPNGEIASDLLHEVFCKWLGLDARSRRAIDSAEAYLFQIARNLLRDRTKMARRRFYDLHVPSDDAMLESPALEPQLEARDMLGRVEAAMLQLKPRTREVFMARRLDGLSYAEISDQTGLSFKIIEKEMARAIAHLHRLFGEE